MSAWLVGLWGNAGVTAGPIFGAVGNLYEAFAAFVIVILVWVYLYLCRRNEP
jgi:hypothetical protein